MRLTFQLYEGRIKALSKDYAAATEAPPHHWTGQGSGTCHPLVREHPGIHFGRVRHSGRRRHELRRNADLAYHEVMERVGKPFLYPGQPSQSATGLLVTDSEGNEIEILGVK